MNAQMKKQLEKVITSIVEENNEAAKKAFHEYLRAKTKSVLLGESKEEDEDEDEDNEGEETEDEKSDDTPPFKKKSKKDKDDEDDE